MGKDILESSDFVKIAGAIGGMLLVIIVVFVIFAKKMMASVLPSIVWGFVVLGIVLGMFSMKSKKK